jgi:hypothetical protein
VEIFFELMALMAVVRPLNGLFKADGDEDAEDDDEEVSEEFAARHGSVLGRVDVDHGWLLKVSGSRLTWFVCRIARER